MRSPAPGSLPRTLRLSPSTPQGGSPRFPRPSGPRWPRRSSALFAFLLAGASCRFVGHAPLSPQLQVRARLLRIEDTRRDEPALIDSLLSCEDGVSRAGAALAVGRIGARTHLATLRRLATDPDSSVSASALFSLGLLKDTASASLAALALRSPRSVAVEAAWLLGELGDRGRAAIVAGLEDPSLGSPARGALLLAATRLRPVPAAAIAPWLQSRDSAIACLAPPEPGAVGAGTTVASQLGEMSSPNSSWNRR